MANLESGVIKAISLDNYSFKIGEEWYRLGKSCDVDIHDLKKGDTVTFEFNTSEYKGRQTNWVNVLNFGEMASNGHSKSHDDPRDETPPIGKFASQGEMTKVDFNIMFGMCFNNACLRAKPDKSWKEILEETEDLTIKVLISREDLWARTKNG